ncbi:MAG: rhomboid family intramembrane serine protease [Candidatus Hydrogenedentes bacterium]|nr:rhomboid family intramembrane serine protease [Candidatus Hydrogenedentota bacterium]
MSNVYYERRYSYSAAGGRPITFAVQRLIVATTIAFAIQLIVFIPAAAFGALPLTVEYWLGLNPALLRFGAVWQLATYIFLHGSLMHLFFNMLTLYFFGPDVERILSTRQFFRFYFLCGIVGGICQFGLSIAQGSNAPTIGASGATLGVLAACAVAYPKREVYLFPLPFPLYMWALAVLFFVLSLTSDRSAGGTAWAAHAGGMAFGFAYMKLVPVLREWFERFASRARKVDASKEPLDAVGEAVDNIFKFDEEKKKRK